MVVGKEEEEKQKKKGKKSRGGKRGTGLFCRLVIVGWWGTYKRRENENRKRGKEKKRDRTNCRMVIVGSVPSSARLHLLVVSCPR